jgi:hypothetical protein
MIPNIRKSIVCLKLPRLLPACPSDKSNVKMKMSMEHWWNGTDRRITEIHAEKPL